ncbi:MAG: glycosyltransferase family 39 protein [bacterium]
MKSTIDKVYRVYERYRYEIYLAVISVLALIVHIHLASTLNLGNDEAHYYVWSLKPSPGYLDDAPLVSYVILFFTGIFGKSQLGVRLGAVIFSFLDGFLIYYSTYMLFKNKRASFLAFLFFLSAVIFSTVLSVMILPDAPLLFFYLCFLIFFYKAAESFPSASKTCFDKRRREYPRKRESRKAEGSLVSGLRIVSAQSGNNLSLWLLAGVFLGLAFLSKYTAALIPPSALLYLAVSKKHRGLLKTFYPYMALGISLIIFSPVIYWNITHNFISFKFQLSHGFSHPKPGLFLFMAGWLGQFLVITPFIYIFLIGALIYSLKNLSFPRNLSFPSASKTCFDKRRREYLRKQESRIYKKALIDKNGSELDSRLRGNDKAPCISESLLYSVCLSLPVLLFFILNGYSHRILVHWPDIGYLPAFPVMGYVADLLTGNSAVAGAAYPSGAWPDTMRPMDTTCPMQSRLFYRLLKYYVYFSIFSGFFLFFVLYNQIYYNSIPAGKIIKYIDKQKRLKKDGIFALIPHIPGKPETADITNDLFGWKTSAKYIGIVFNGYKTAYRPLFILTHHYAIADELVYYGGYKPAVNIYNISGFLNQYDLWQNLNKINGKNALFVMDDKYMLNPAKAYKKDFKSVKEIGRLDIYVKFRPVRVYYLYLMKDFNAKTAIKQLTAESRMY